MRGQGGDGPGGSRRRRRDASAGDGDAATGGECGRGEGAAELRLLKRAGEELLGEGGRGGRRRHNVHGSEAADSGGVPVGDGSEATRWARPWPGRSWAGPVRKFFLQISRQINKKAN